MPDRWYEKLGVQINHPPPAEPRREVQPPDYERPPLWRRSVAPMRVLFPPYVVTFLVLLAAGSALRVDDSVAFAVAIGCAFIAQGALDLHWRRNNPPSADPVRFSFWAFLKGDR